MGVSGRAGDQGIRAALETLLNLSGSFFQKGKERQEEALICGVIQHRIRCRHVHQPARGGRRRGGVDTRGTAQVNAELRRIYPGSLAARTLRQRVAVPRAPLFKTGLQAFRPDSQPFET